jgi:hypothetical protein
MTRNFYGTLRVKDTGPETSETAMRRLMHGVIMHGEQYLHKDKRTRITTYYTETSGVGYAVKYYQQQGPVRVGVVGLGAGTMAAYGRQNDVVRFYEINPQVIDIARRDFKYIADATALGAQVDTVLGDARLTMEREPAQRYHVLAIDAFSSDAIPVHLITREAMGIYLKHISDDGVSRHQPLFETGAGGQANRRHLWPAHHTDYRRRGRRRRLAHRLGAGHQKQETPDARSDQKQCQRDYRDPRLALVDGRL